MIKPAQLKDPVNFQLTTGPALALGNGGSASGEWRKVLPFRRPAENDSTGRGTAETSQETVPYLQINWQRPAGYSGFMGFGTSACSDIQQTSDQRIPIRHLSILARTRDAEEIFIGDHAFAALSLISYQPARGSAAIIETGGRYAIEGRDDSVRINGHELFSDDRITLCPGDIIQIGAFKLTYGEHPSLGIQLDGAATLEHEGEMIALPQHLAFTSRGRLVGSGGHATLDEWNRRFFKGGYITKDSGDRYMYIAHPRNLGGVETGQELFGDNVYAYYQEWRKKHSYVYTSSEESAMALDGLKSFLSRQKITFNRFPMRYEQPGQDDVMGGVYRDLLEALKLCPPQLLASGAIAHIDFSGERRGTIHNGHFRFGRMSIYDEVLRCGNRPLLQQHILYLVGQSLFDILDEPTRTRLSELFQTIINRSDIITIDTPSCSAESRREDILGLRTQRLQARFSGLFEIEGTRASPPEFLAETFMIYVLAGQHLRSQIDRIADHKSRNAYLAIYEFLRRLYDGREFTEETTHPL